MGSFLQRASKLVRLLSRAQYRRGLRHRMAAAIEHTAPMRALEFGTLIDVGANIGQFSLLVRNLHPDALIYAFEPLPFAAVRYSKLFAQDSKVHLYCIAAGEVATSAQIHVSGRPDSSSLLSISDTQTKTFPGTGEVTQLTVEVDRPDNVLKDVPLVEPVLVKLDVQGYELEALRGMMKLLPRVKYVYCEVSFKELYIGQPLAHEVISWLAEHNFKISGVFNTVDTTDGAAVQADILFTNCVLS
jgi:FkbM family methyltransferase